MVYFPDSNSSQPHIIHQPTCLHKGVTDCGADKLKPRFFSALDRASEADVDVGIRSTLWLVSPVADDLQTTRQVGKRFAVLFHLQVRPRITNNA